MGYAWNAVAFVVLALVSSSTTAQAVSEPEVVELLARVDRALPARDIDVLAESLSDDAQISGALTVGTDVQPYSYTKREYLQELRNTWAMVSEYRYRRTNQKIVIAEGVATVTADVAETAVLPGGVLRSTVRETTTVERVGGKVLITKVVGLGTVAGEAR